MAASFQKASIAGPATRMAALEGCFARLCAEPPWFVPQGLALISGIMASYGAALAVCGAAQPPPRASPSHGRLPGRKSSGRCRRRACDTAMTLSGAVFVVVVVVAVTSSLFSRHQTERHPQTPETSCIEVEVEFEVEPSRGKV